MRRRRSGTGCIVIGLMLIAAAMGLSIYNMNESNRASEAATTVAVELLGQIEAQKPAQEPAEQSSGSPVEEPLPDYLVYPEITMPTIEIDGERYIGCLEIPDLQLALPVTGGQWAESNLKIAPGQYSGSAYQNDLVIGAHNYVRHFGRLKTLKNGAKVFFTDAEGNRFAYTVGWSEVLEENDVEGMVQADDWDLTLYTCTYGGEKRLAVRCTQAELWPAEKRNDLQNAY